MKPASVRLVAFTFVAADAVAILYDQHGRGGLLIGLVVWTGALGVHLLLERYGVYER